jgi:hypothetical protein
MIRDAVFNPSAAIGLTSAHRAWRIDPILAPRHE